MNPINSFILEGELDPKVIYDNQLKKCIFFVATIRNYTNKHNEAKQEVSVFECQAFGGLAEVCKNQHRPTRKVRIVGRLKDCREITTTGTISKVVVIVEHIEYEK